MTDLTPEAQDLYASLTEIPWQLWLGIVVLVGGSYLLARATVGYTPLTERYVADVQAERKERIDEAAARAEENATTLAFVTDPDEQAAASESFQALADKPFDWPTIERHLETHRRADIAKTRRQNHGARQMRATWERPFGGDAA